MIHDGIMVSIRLILKEVVEMYYLRSCRLDDACRDFIFIRLNLSAVLFAWGMLEVRVPP